LLQVLDTRRNYCSVPTVETKFLYSNEKYNLKKKKNKNQYFTVSHCWHIAAGSIRSAIIIWYVYSTPPRGGRFVWIRHRAVRSVCATNRTQQCINTIKVFRFLYSETRLLCIYSIVYIYIYRVHIYTPPEQDLSHKNIISYTIRRRRNPFLDIICNAEECHNKNTR